MTSLSPAPGQHYRIELQQAKQDYHDGLLTASGLLYYVVGIMRKPGQEIRLSVREWLNLTGLKERTFYSAKAKLIAAGRISERITGIVTLWISSAVDKVVQLLTPSTNDESLTGQTCTILQEDCTMLQEDCTMLQEDCTMLQNEPLQPNHSNASEVPSTNSTNTTKPSKRGVEKFKRLQDSLQLPTDLKAKLEELEILKGSSWDNKVYEALARYDFSQAYKAAEHVKNTWQNIDNPRSVFLFQLPRQLPEALGSRQRVMTAKSFGYTVTDLKRMYGSGWKQAAEHFGIQAEGD